MPYARQTTRAMTYPKPGLQRVIKHKYATITLATINDLTHGHIKQQSNTNKRVTQVTGG